MKQDSYYGRAVVAYLKRFGPSACQPGGVESGDNVYEYNGKRYVVLHNVNGILAVYRITNEGQLRWLVRYPKAALEA